MSSPSKAKREYAFQQPINEEKLEKQRIYYVYRAKGEQEAQPWFPGNIFDLKYQGDGLGEAQVVLVEAMRFEDLTEYDAILTGFEDEEALRGAVGTWLGLDPLDPKAGFYKVLFRWL